MQPADRNILITGGLGYIGRYVVKELLEHNYRVVSLDISTAEHDHFDGETVIHGDYGDLSLTRSIFEKYQIEAVIHLAAKTDVGESIREPLNYYDVNIAGTLSLLRSMSEAGVKKLLFASSAAVYGDPKGNQPVSEDRQPAPFSPYGFSKYMAEQMLLDISKTSGLSFLAMRYFNVAGQDATKGIRKVAPKINLIIPLLAQVANQQRDISPEDYDRVNVLAEGFETRDGTCVRDYVHVCDIARAHRLGLELLANKAEVVAEVVNIGTENISSIKDVVESTKKITNWDLQIQWQARRPGYPTFLVSDSQKAKKLLNWQAEQALLDQIVQSESEYSAAFNC